jgi:hypothetical protein
MYAGDAARRSMPDARARSRSAVASVRHRFFFHNATASRTAGVAVRPEKAACADSMRWVDGVCGGSALRA